MRGEQSISFCSVGMNLGSPPLARGTVAVPIAVTMSMGITPACAGNSQRDRRRASRLRDHPRLRGEQQAVAAGYLLSQGSPPLARGTAAELDLRLVCEGITPACAGNSSIPLVSKRRYRDHPRLRGEQALSSWLVSGDVGSPPLARGTAKSTRSSCRTARITPACAGNSVLGEDAVGGQGDHPRLRGEQRSSVMPVRLTMGSPPLARGTAAVDGFGRAVGGITPACAGNSRL